MRPRAPLPEDPRLHMAALVYLADFYSHWPFERRIFTRDGVLVASAAQAALIATA